VLAEPSVVPDQAEREAQFREIGPGLTEELLRKAVKTGHEDSLNCTAFNSRGGAGFRRWDTAVAVVREGLRKAGWELDDTGNLPTAVSPCGKWEVAVSSADSQTGRPGKDPKTARPKGAETQARVHSNQMSLADVDETFPRIVKKKIETDCVTCMLLYFVDEIDNEVRMEFSIPKGFDAQGRVSSFAKRYPLEPWTTPQAVLEDTAELAEETEVHVERIQNG
jgi:hypothetical protein